MRLAFAALLALLATGALAGQSDPRLDRLFERLKSVEDRAEAGTIEESIWRIWLESGDRASDSLMALGVQAMQSGDLAGALALFDAVVEAKPDFAEGWNKRATVLFMGGRHEDSAKDVDKTLTLEPRHFGALAGRGLIYFAKDKPAAALKAFEAALAVNPHMPGVKANVEALRKKLKAGAI